MAFNPMALSKPESRSSSDFAIVISSVSVVGGTCKLTVKSVIVLLIEGKDIRVCFCAFQY
jgi:hypothetical protein